MQLMLEQFEEAQGLLAARHGSVVRFTYGQKSDWEVRLVASGATFAWMRKGDRLWRMMAIRAVWTPVQVLEFMRANDNNTDACLQLAGVRPPNGITERQPPGEAVAHSETSQTTINRRTEKRGGCSLQ